MMDQAKQMFREEFGRPERIREWPLEAKTDLGLRLPKELNDFIVEEGRGPYLKGLFWWTDPRPFDLHLAKILTGTPIEGADEFSVIGRSAMGDLLVFGRNHLGNFIVRTSSGSITTSIRRLRSRPKRDSVAVLTVLSGLKRSNFDIRNEDGDSIFGNALSALGQLEEDEVYASPAIPVVAILEDKAEMKRISLLPFIDIVSEYTRYNVIDIDV